METDATAQPPAATPTVPKAQVFSDAEKEVLVQFRAAVPDIVKMASEKAPSPVSATIWGVPLLPTEEEGEETVDPRIDVVLVKFLRARNNCLDEAGKMLAGTLKWRAEFDIDALMDET
ncbi:Non-classical phosphatidylinositol transfer protein (PITP), partial [Coemansia sp. RSA 1933]